MSENPQAQIAYRMGRALDSIREAEALANIGLWNGCVNRLYYACFFAISALMAREGLAANKHTRVRSFFNQHFVRTGLVSRDFGTLYNDLFENRQDADYVDYVSFDEQRVRPWIEGAQRFVTQVEEILQSS